MALRWIRVALLMLATGLAAGCSGSSADNPFEGTWVSISGTAITFGESTWHDSEGDTGDYSYTGEHPVYTVTFVTAGGNFFKRATFVDADTLELCSLFAGGFVSSCEDFVIDRPTVH